MTVSASPTAASGGSVAVSVPTLGWRKKVVFTAIVFLVFLLGSECIARVASYLAHDRNPYYLLYGFRSWTGDDGVGHSEKHDGYFKFPPDQVIRYGTPEPCRINNHGFRGADFAAEKPANTFRIMCLGASSTFGYLNTDDGTYPVVLAGLLGPRLAGREIEVINAGIPHFTTDNILAALEQEVFDYEPDLVTIYTGCNDAVRPLAETGWQRSSRVLDEYSAAYAGIRKLVNRALGPILFSQWTGYLATMDQPSIERQLRLHEQRTRGNFERILELTAERGIEVVVIRQPITLWFDRVERGLARDSDPRTTYEEEHERIVTQLRDEGYVQGFEVPLLVHHRLQEIIEELARERDLAVVDNVALVAEVPTGLGSRVHLTRQGNERLAGALHEAVRPIVERSLGASAGQDDGAGDTTGEKLARATLGMTSTEQGRPAARTHGFFAELRYFLRNEKKWWLTPIVLVVLGIGALMLMGGSSSSPFVYSLF